MYPVHRSCGSSSMTWSLSSPIWVAPSSTSPMSGRATYRPPRTAPSRRPVPLTPALPKCWNSAYVHPRSAPASPKPYPPRRHPFRLRPCSAWHADGGDRAREFRGCSRSDRTAASAPSRRPPSPPRRVARRLCESPSTVPPQRDRHLRVPRPPIPPLEVVNADSCPRDVASRRRRLYRPRTSRRGHASVVGGVGAFAVEGLALRRR